MSRHTRVPAVALFACLLLPACTPAGQSASSPYCDDYARTHSTLYGVHYSVETHLDEQDALRAWCMQYLYPR